MKRTLTTICVPAEIPTYGFPNTNPRRYRFRLPTYVINSWAHVFYIQWTLRVLGTNHIGLYRYDVMY
jgi:hypothetical protein